MAAFWGLWLGMIEHILQIYTENTSWVEFKRLSCHCTVIPESPWASVFASIKWWQLWVLQMGEWMKWCVKAWIKTWPTVGSLQRALFPSQLFPPSWSSLWGAPMERYFDLTQCSSYGVLCLFSLRLVHLIFSTTNGSPSRMDLLFFSPINMGILGASLVFKLAVHRMEARFHFLCIPCHVATCLWITSDHYKHLTDAVLLGDYEQGKTPLTLNVHPWMKLSPLSLSVSVCSVGILESPISQG